MSQTSNEFYEMKQNLRVYNRIPKRSIREAKALFYNNKFNQLKGDSKKTWSTINDIIKRSDFKQLLLDYLFINNEKVSDQDDIVNYFNIYLVRLELPWPPLYHNLKAPLQAVFQGASTHLLSSCLLLKNKLAISLKAEMDCQIT